MGIPLRQPGESWGPVEVRLIDPRDEIGRPPWPRRHAYLPWFVSNGLILRDEAIARIGPLLDRWGELLPLACDEADLVFFNALHLEDVVDQGGPISCDSNRADA